MNPRHLRPEDLRGRRWRGLVRESSAEQARKETTPERQRADLRRAASELGMTDAEPLFYERVGSGEAEDVPELQRALVDGKAGQYDVLVVFHTSRFARNRAEAVRMKVEFRKAGIVLYFVAQRIVSGAFTSALSEGMNEVLDEYENEQRRLWIAGGLRERQKSGRWHGAVPYGYRRELVDFPDGSRGWDGGLEPDPETAPVVRAVFDQIAAGGRLRDVAFRLNVAGHRTPMGNPWTNRGVSGLVTNPVYLGRFIRYRRTTAPHYYDASDESDGLVDLGEPFPALVDALAFRAATEAIKLRRPAWRDPQHPQRSYPLSSVLRCPRGHRMTGAAGTGTIRYYRCRQRAADGSCDATYLRANEVEAAFARWLASYQLPADWREEIARSRVKTVKADEGDRQRRLRERLTRISKLYEWGDKPEAEYRAEAAAIKAELGVMTMPTIGSLEDVAAALERLGPAWASAPPELQAPIPPLMLHAAEVNPDGVEWVVRAELKPLLDLCVSGDSGLYSVAPRYTVRYSA
jgi:site-specific DNA recombinase